MRKLELIVDGVKGNSVDYNRINLNSNFSKADKEHIDLGASIINGIRTIEFDIELTTNQNNQDNVISRYSGGVGRLDVSFQSGNKFKAAINNGTFYVHNSNYVMPLNTLVTVSVRFDAIDGCRFFYNGLPEGVNNTLMNTSIVTSAINTYIGGLQALPGLNRYTRVKLSNLKLWSSSRTDSEILSGVGVYLTGSEIGLVETFHFKNETGFTVTGENSNTGTISTLNAGGVSHVDTVMRELFTVGLPGTPAKSFEFDLYEDETISVIKKGVDIEDLSDRSSGTTNSFNLPLTANNNRILDYLEVEGNLSNVPYEINYVRYTQNGVELIPKGRVNINGINKDGYNVDIIHGINGFFDLIRGKYLWEAYEPYRTTLNEMVYSQTSATNDLTVSTDEGYIVALMDLGNINPIPEFQQQISYFIDFGIDKIATGVGYELTNLDVDLNELVFTPKDVPSFDSIKKQFGREFTFLGSGVPFTLFSYVLEKKSYISFNLKLVQLLATITDSPSIEILVDGVVVFTDVVPNNFTGYDYTNTYDSTPIIYDQGSVIEVRMISALPYGAVQSRRYFCDSIGLFDDNSEVYHENFLKEYTQDNLIKSIRQMLNIGFEVNETFKTIEIFQLDKVFDSSYGNVIDLSDYFDRVISKTFSNDYGKTNLFKYTYDDKQAPFADGTLVANNYNKEATLIESDITPSLNNTEFTLGTDTVYLTTAKTYEDNTVSSNKETIGDRINKVLRYDTSGGNPVTVDYIDVLGTTTNVDSNQSILSFTGLDWQTLIENNYSNIRDKVLNRYAKYKVSMNVPFYIIKDFSVKDKIFIDSLGANFVVQEIRTLQDGLSEWTLIKLNEV